MSEFDRPTKAGLSAAEIAARLDRPVYGVESRIAALGLRRSYDDGWPSEDDETLIKSYGDGLTVEAIASRLGCTSAQVTTRVEHLRAEGVELAARKPRWTAADRERLARRYREGATYEQLAVEFGKSKGSISRQLQRMRAADSSLNQLATISTMLTICRRACTGLVGQIHASC